MTRKHAVCSPTPGWEDSEMVRMTFALLRLSDDEGNHIFDKKIREGMLDAEIRREYKKYFLDPLLELTRAKIER